jgi:quinoprotein glucose dehydrogenase
MHRPLLNWLLPACLTLFLGLSLPAFAEKPRLAVLTDIGGDPDDQQSLVRLMIYANEFELEALIASASGTPGELKEAVTKPHLIREIVEAYGQVLPNLRRHAEGWPSAESLLAVIRSGNPHRGRDHIGEGHDTDGSRHLIDRIDAGSAARPLNLTIWGGQTDFAQALWRVRRDRGEAGYRDFIAKVRIFDIADQDGIGSWMRTEFPGLFYILSKAAEGADKRAASFRGMYLTGDEDLTSPEWIERHVRNSGPLGRLYPLKTWTAPNPHGCMKEGDTPSWFFFLPQGGNDPADPTRPGWGGQFRRAADGWYVDLDPADGVDPRQTVSRWRPDFQADFARRMAWCRSDALTLEDPEARARLPEFKTIPAAGPQELSAAQPLDAAGFTGWARSQGDNGARRYSALDQITKENVHQLEVAWTYRSGDRVGNLQCTPIIVDGTLYAPTPGHALVALDAATGHERWRYQVEGLGRRLQDTPARRGLVYWPGNDTASARILFGAGDWIYALDPDTGKPVPGFGENGRTSIPTGATAAGVVYRDVYVTTGLNGDTYGYDVRTGALRWKFRSVARDDDFGADTWDGPQAGANGWSGLSLDDARGLVFVALGAPRPDMVGVDRLGDNLFGNCIVALDALTGERRWHFQDVRHDIWDLDVCAPPNLVTIEKDGRRVDVVTSMSKAGHLFVLDRETGKPVFPVRLRRAPVSTLPGERTAPYQPDPELPEPISRMEFHPDMITNRTPEARAFVEAIVAKSTHGFFEPFTPGVPNLFIGTRGGAEWSGAAVDVPTGRLYVTSNRWVSRITVIPNDDKERDPRHPPSAGELVYQQHCAACHGPTRQGIGVAPPLLGLKHRLTDADVLALIAQGRGAMPPNLLLGETEKTDLLDYLFRRNQPPVRGGGGGPGTAREPKYVFGGFGFLVDHEGYPGIKPPWGLLNCYDLATGKALWRVPLGEHEELTRQGVPLTGSQNLGGASVTAGGLVFVAGTSDERLRAFDADTGEELWSAKLPHAGTSAPAIYEAAGRQFVVITATGGGRVGGASGPGDAYVAFALPAASANR